MASRAIKGKQMDNINKSTFRKGEHVGHANGSWRVRRNAKGWIATKQNGGIGKLDMPIRGKTLLEISRALTAIEAKIAEARRGEALPNPFAGAPLLPE